MMTRETKTPPTKSKKREKKRESVLILTENKEQKNERDFFAKFHIFSLDKKKFEKYIFEPPPNPLSFLASKSHKLYR